MCHVLRAMPTGPCLARFIDAKAHQPLALHLSDVHGSAVRPAKAHIAGLGAEHVAFLQ